MRVLVRITVLRYDWAGTDRPEITAHSFFSVARRDNVERRHEAHDTGHQKKGKGRILYVFDIHSPSDMCRRWAEGCRAVYLMVTMNVCFRIWAQSGSQQWPDDNLAPECGQRHEGKKTEYIRVCKVVMFCPAWSWSWYPRSYPQINLSPTLLFLSPPCHLRSGRQGRLWGSVRTQESGQGVQKEEESFMNIFDVLLL